MKNVVIYLPLKPFIRQYLIHHFGNPVKFPAQSITNKCITSVLQLRRKDGLPEVAGEGRTPVVIPDNCAKNPAVWNFVSKFGKKLICQHIESVFSMCIWTEMSNACEFNDQKQQDAAYDFCSRHGIDLDYADTIRMRYYRDKISFLDQKIDLRSRRRAKKPRF